jgi:hypothetical protein
VELSAVNKRHKSFECREFVDERICNYFLFNFKRFVYLSRDHSSSEEESNSNIGARRYESVKCSSSQSVSNEMLNHCKIS